MQRVLRLARPALVRANQRVQNSTRRGDINSARCTMSTAPSPGSGAGAGTSASGTGDGEERKFQIITEGSATITFPLKNEVFYNKVQILNRDLSIAAVRLFDRTRRRTAKQNVARRKTFLRDMLRAQEEGKEAPERPPPASADTSYTLPGLRILEALAASGLRSIRYYREISGVDEIIVNDLSDDAVESIRRNVEFNGLDPTRVVPHRGDAVAYMMENRETHKQFDVVDLDPYGTPNIFVDSAVQSVADGGLLCITATDMPTLCGQNLQAAYAKYGSVLVKTKCCHEVALRTVLAMVARQAAVYKRVVEPLLSVSVDFYIRMFVRVRNSAKGAQAMGTKQSYYYQCTGCHTIHLQPLATMKKGLIRPATGPSCPAKCPECGGHFQMGGPIWSAPIADGEFVDELLRDLEAGIDEAPNGAVAAEKAAAGATSSGSGAGAGAGAGAGGAGKPAVVADVKESVATTLGSDAGSNSAKTVAASRVRLTGLIRAYSQEAHDCPLYASLPDLCARVHCSIPPMLSVIAAISNAGYKVSQSHIDPEALKTNAPYSLLWDILRTWEADHPVRDKYKSPELVSGRLLAKAPTAEINFEPSAEVRRHFLDRKSKSRYSLNPEGYWGPKSRAKSSTGTKTARSDDAGRGTPAKRART